MAEDLFVQQQIVDPNKNYYEDLVGEGKKYKDNEALARAAIFKDHHISQIETENKGMREDLTGRQRMEELIEKFSSVQNSKPDDNDGQPGREVGTPVPALKSEDLDQLIEQKLSAKQQQMKREENLATVKTTLSQKLGPNYSNKLREQAQNLNVSETFLTTIAAENPQAFYRLVGLDARQEQGLFTPPQSSVNSSGLGTSPTQLRNKAFYTKLRQENPAEYWSVQTQNRIHEDAFALGDKWDS
jgi:hypothetical protein